MRAPGLLDVLDASLATLPGLTQLDGPLLDDVLLILHGRVELVHALDLSGIDLRLFLVHTTT